MKLSEGLIREELYRAALEFYDAQPWEAIPDSSVFGLCLYRSDIPFFCSVLGNEGLVRGLSVYPGLRGWRSLQRIFGASEKASWDEEMLYEQNCINLIFGKREKLLPRELDFLKKKKWDDLEAGG